jgi:hypothetical protein
MHPISVYSSQPLMYTVGIQRKVYFQASGASTAGQIYKEDQ